MFDNENNGNGIQNSLYFRKAQSVETIETKDAEQLLILPYISKYYYLYILSLFDWRGLQIASSRRPLAKDRTAAYVQITRTYGQQKRSNEHLKLSLYLLLMMHWDFKNHGKKLNCIKGSRVHFYSRGSF